MIEKEQININLNKLPKVNISNAIWPLILVALIAFLGYKTFHLGEIKNTEVGVILNKITGESKVITQSGKHYYNSFTQVFYTLDKTQQIIEMTAVRNRGDRAGRDDIKVKTVDGSNVYVNLKIRYQITNPTKADLIIKTSGPGDAYKHKWIRDYTRALCRTNLGKLTTEEFYNNAAQRTAYLQEAKAKANKKLERFGLTILQIVMTNEPNFPREYTQKINERKRADQEVLKELSHFRAMKQKQLTIITEETNKKNVTIEEFRGKIARQNIKAEAEAEKVKKMAEAYYKTTTIDAQANLIATENKAKAILTQKRKEAEGIQAMTNALVGEGGRNMVKLEYAKRLQNIIINGQPYSIDNKLERFQHLYSPAASEAAAKNNK